MFESSADASVPPQENVPSASAGPDDPSSWFTRGLGRLSFAVVALTLIAHAAYYWPFLSDDALISLRYADRFADGLGLTWTDGERVEGYTDFLWVVLTAALHFVGVPLIAAARGLGLLGCLAGALLACIDPDTGKPSAERVLTSGIGLALCAPVAVWAIGALEHGFMVGAIAGVLFLFARSEKEYELSKNSWGAAVLLSALALLRADGAVLVFGLALPMLFVRRPGGIKKFLVWAGLPMLAVALQHLFRFSYYGQWVPNTALAKVAMNQERILLGLRHVGTGLFAIWPTLVGTIVAFVAGVRGMSFTRYAPALFATVVWCVYLALVGGDIFPGWRQLLLGIVPLYFLLGHAAQSAVERFRKESSSIHMIAAVVALLGLSTQTRDSENQRGKTERWEWAGASVGPALKRAFGSKRPLLAVDAAGALPFWSELPCLDMLGLNDSYLAHNPPKSFGTGGIGHELGDGAYVLSRKPDLIAFNNAQGSATPIFLSGRQMIGTTDFRKSYSLMKIQGLGESPAIGEVYVRKDGKAGATYSAEGVTIPGYFLSQGDGLASFSADGKLVGKLEKGRVARLDGLDFAPGKYRVVVQASTSEVEVAVRCNGKSMLGPHSASPVVSLDAGSQLSLVVSSRTDGAFVRAVQLDKVSEEPNLRCSSSSVRTTLEALSRVKKENSAWDAPSNVVFSRGTLTVNLPTPSRASRASLSVDNNDIYDFEFLSNGLSRGKATVDKKNNGGGLAVHQIEIPEAARNEGFDAIRVRARSGDGSYSLGHLTLE
jgi:arabinofuranosyltransferase